MSLFLATLLFGLALAAMGVVFVMNRPPMNASIVALPRSSTAAIVFFGGAAAWFLWLTWNSEAADNFDHPRLLTAAFAAVAVLSFKAVPDFLAVRGLAILTLLTAWHFRAAAYMQYAHPQRLVMVTPLFLIVIAAIWLGVQPYRLRDFLGWTYAAPRRARTVGAVLLGYGLIVAAVAFTY
jgi:hypothetical protein